MGKSFSLWMSDSFSLGSWGHVYRWARGSCKVYTALHPREGKAGRQKREIANVAQKKKSKLKNHQIGEVTLS